MDFFYKLLIKSYQAGLFMAAPFHEKASKMLEGRRHIFKQLEIDFSVPKTHVAWFHCASLGEFEQGRPLLEAFRAKYPMYTIVLTFFSPSGYEIRKNYAHADYVYYLPFDSPSHAKTWFELLKPAVIFFVKYEFWHYYLAEAKKRTILTLSFSAIFRKEQLFFSATFRWFFPDGVKENFFLL